MIDQGQPASGRQQGQPGEWASTWVALMTKLEPRSSIPQRGDCAQQDITAFYSRSRIRQQGALLSPTRGVSEM
jgi:hypothetical protein